MASSSSSPSSSSPSSSGTSRALATGQQQQGTHDKQDKDSCSTSSPKKNELSPTTIAAQQQSSTQRSLSLTTGERTQLHCIAEDAESPSAGSPSSASGTTSAASAPMQPKPLTVAQQKRATLVKKAIRYFEDKSNRSVSEDNLFTRRKNLAVHLGLDDKVSKREVQKINTYCLPVPSSATSFDVPDPVAARNVASASCVGITAASDRSATAAAAAATIVIEEDEEEDIKSKNLVSFLGMKDGFTASMASQGSLSDSPRGSMNSARPAAATSGDSTGVISPEALGHAMSKHQIKDSLFKF